MPAFVQETAQQQIRNNSIWIPFCGCWLWTGNFNKNGYAIVGKNCTKLAHRLSWLAFRGPIPEGKCVCHSCDTPSCVNPYHLFLGTQTDNIADRNRKGRTAKGKQNGMVLHPERNGMILHPEKRPKGERNGSAKLKEGQISEIFHLRGEGWTQKKLALHFEVNRSCIYKILYGKTWKDVPKSLP